MSGNESLLEAVNLRKTEEAELFFRGKPNKSSKRQKTITRELLSAVPELPRA